MQLLTVRTSETEGHSLEAKMIMWYLFTGTRGSINRIRIISLLKKRPMNRNQISVELKLDYKVIMHHMKVLEKNNMIKKFGIGYGANYFTSLLFESHQEIFNEIITKVKNL